MQDGPSLAMTGWNTYSKQRAKRQQKSRKDIRMKRTLCLRKPLKPQGPQNRPTLTLMIAPLRRGRAVLTQATVIKTVILVVAENQRLLQVAVTTPENQCRAPAFLAMESAPALQQGMQSKKLLPKAHAIVLPIQATIPPMGHAPAPLAMGNAPAIQLHRLAIRRRAPAPLVTGNGPILQLKRIAPVFQQAMHQAMLQAMLQAMHQATRQATHQTIAEAKIAAKKDPGHIAARRGRAAHLAALATAASVVC